MHYLIAFDENYRPGGETLIYSITRHAPTSESNIFFIPYVGSFDPLPKRLIRPIDSIVPVPIPKEAMVKQVFDGWPTSIWLKLISLFFLPKNVAEILYIDSDCVVDGRLDSFYRQDFGDACIVGVEEPISELYKIYPLLGAKTGYINTGVMLISLPRFLSRLRSVDQLHAAINDVAGYLELPDQDFVNYFFRQEIATIKPNHVMCMVTRNICVPQHAMILHYSAAMKPWVGRKSPSQYKPVFWKIFWKYGIRALGLRAYLVAQFYSGRLFIKRAFRYFLRKVNRVK